MSYGRIRARKSAVDNSTGGHDDLRAPSDAACRVLDVNETPSDLGPMRERFQQVGLPTCAGR
jgi:hypothetical protein